MDMKNLVEKITRDVMETLKDNERPAPSSSPGADSPRAGTVPAGRAILVADTDFSPDQWMRLLSDGVKEYELVVLACSSVRVPEDSRVRNRIKEVIYYREGMPIASPIQEARSLIYVASQPWQMAQLVSLMNNNPAVSIILDALSRGVHVMVIDSIARKGCAWEKKIDEHIKELCAMGICVEKITGPGSTSVPELVSRACEMDKGECAGCGLCAALVPRKVDVVREAGADRISSAPGAKGINTELASMIDHTLLKPDATKEQVIKLCEEARQYVFASVCINPAFVKLSAECLKGSPVKVCTVIGFPLGATTSVTKEIETRDAIANGADEIDMVINVGALKAGNYELVQKDIETVVAAACGRIVKVILETALLTDEEKVMACKLSKKAGADFVKTSTGFGPGGATAQDIALMRQTVGKYMGVKASGGIRDLETAQKMIEAGATRIGASASVAIVKGEKSESKY